MRKPKENTKMRKHREKSKGENQKGIPKEKYKRETKGEYQRRKPKENTN